MSTATINKYPFFENNQVLTSTQLNELSGYLDQQTRMTRYRLIGIGALCGLVPSWDAVTRKLIVTGGTGVTSEGYLFETGKCEFVQYRTYTLPVSVEYNKFIDPADSLQVDLYELLPTGTVPAGVNLTSAFVTDKVLLYFLEIVDVENDSCLGKSCDTFGFERTYTLRKLLVSINDAKIILANSSSTDLTYTAKFDLPEMLAVKPLFNPALAHSKDYFQFSQNYKFAAASVYKRVPTDPKDLLNVLRQTYTIFEPILKDIYGNVNPFNTIPNINIWDEIMDGVNGLNGPSYFGIQYFYDFLRDLLLAYNEFKDAAFELMSDCCFDTDLFPKHLLLGEVMDPDPDRPSALRHYFVNISLTPAQRVAKDTLIAYHIRMVLMIRKFDIAIVHNPGTGTPPTFPVTRITPSFEKWGKLSQRSIPFYYKIDEPDASLGTLERVWNYQNVLRNRDVANQYPVVAYGNQSPNQIAPISPTETPLWYDQDQFTFLRVEGTFRKNFNTALAEVNAIKNEFDLPINAVAVRLQGTATPEEIMARCNFDDLRSQYTAQRNEFLCKWRRFFDHFFTKDAKGSFVLKKVPDFVKSLFTAVPTPQGGGNSSASFLPAYYALPTQSIPRVAVPFQYLPLPTVGIQQDLATWFTLLMNSMIPICQTEILLPEELAQFDYGAETTDTSSSFILTYIEAVSQANNCLALFNMLNDQITHSTRTRFNQELYFTYSQWIGEQMWYLREFISDCQFRGLEAIYYTLQYRVGFLQANDPTTFSNFITRNPGVEHKAGAPYGGTLVLVYPGAPLNFTVKTKALFAEVLQEIKIKEVRKSMLRSIRGRTAQENADLVLVESQLCDLYAQQVTQQGRPVGLLGSPVSAISIRRIAIGAEDVIADFCLPYLTNCDCECDDIPAPTSEDLNLPALAMPQLYDYFCGDFAFANDQNSHTTGCTSPAQVQIDVRPYINYGTGVNVDTMLVLKFVTNGASPVSNFDAKDRAGTVQTITTTRGGTVLISQSASNYQVFIYTPPRLFMGVDSFEYAFEIYDFQGNIRARSNKARITVFVGPRCNTGVVNTAVQVPQNPDA